MNGINCQITILSFARSYLNICLKVMLLVSLSLPWNSLYCQIPGGESQDVLSITKHRGIIFEDCGRNALRLLQGWIDIKQDPETKLFSKGGMWDYQDEAADHYSSLVSVAFYVYPELVQNNGILHQTLVNYQKLCSKVSGIPTLYNLKDRVKGPEAQLGDLTEWLRDGLIRIIEIMGMNNDWYKELERLTDAIIDEANKQGGISEVFERHEDAGNMLQTLTRLYAMSGKEKYLKAAESLAEVKLINLAAIQNDKDTWKGLFADHGCELVPGLGELFALECQVGSPEAKAYKAPFQKLLDNVLKSNCDPHSGLLCDSEVEKDGRKVFKRPPDTWGYVLFAYENYDRGTGGSRYTDAIEKPMKWLIENRPDYENYNRWGLWPHLDFSSDDWSDSYESMIVLWNQYPSVDGVFDWLDWSTLHYHRTNNFNGMEKYGPYTGGHFDGSTGRTLCLHMMLCSQRVRTVPFKEGLCLGGFKKDSALYLSLESDNKWSGKLCFDGLRTEYKTATLNWARINEIPQWFIVRPGRKYRINIFGSHPLILDGQELINGLKINIQAGQLIPVQIVTL
ncbi:MAG: hypothetical protein AB2L24_33115 [Mangrovibacterium sp.]